MNFKEIPYYERSLFMAKLYNHAWYDNNRFITLAKLLEEWDKNPPKEVKFLNQIHNGTDTTEIC
jgi:hypothetical protein